MKYGVLTYFGRTELFRRFLAQLFSSCRVSLFNIAKSTSQIVIMSQKRYYVNFKSKLSDLSKENLRELFKFSQMKITGDDDTAVSAYTFQSVFYNVNVFDKPLCFDEK